MSSHLGRRSICAAAALAVPGMRPGRPAPSGGARAGGAPAHAGREDGRALAPSDEVHPFDEVHLGRHIVGRETAAGHGDHHGNTLSVFVDGKELHVMSNADGTWVSVLNHYEPCTDPHAAARLAVETLRGADLVPLVTA
ncbi:tyrosinase family oxidase copper chaperone [Streptomyces sp. NPDC020379]|uniref:apotyrosinase chaperone MelC1 n=1 Tax=Streptomyces sp. NPDC020379 TaxID=3365071 RepID=UPI0037AEB5FF